MAQVHVFGAEGSYGDPSMEVVVFVWSNKMGHCYECGSPAGFLIIVDPNVSGRFKRDELLRCAVCAANDAADGNGILKLWEDD